MQNFNAKILAKKLIIFLLGLFIIQTGVSLFLQISIGTDPFTVFTNGISKIFNINIGNGNLLLSIFFVLVIILIFKEIKRINIGTLIALVFAGIFINLSNSMLSPLNLSSMNIIVKLVLVVLSCLLVAIGFSMENATNLGVAPNDLFILIFTEKTKIQYKWIRIGFDLTFLTIGFLLCGIDTFGSTLGIGTIINALIQGPMIQFCMERIKILLTPLMMDENIEVKIEQ